MLATPPALYATAVNCVGEMATSIRSQVAIPREVQLREVKETATRRGAPQAKEIAT
jgi:hypothetical protein